MDIARLDTQVCQPRRIMPRVHFGAIAGRLEIGDDFTLRVDGCVTLTDLNNRPSGDYGRGNKQPADWQPAWVQEDGCRDYAGRISTERVVTIISSKRN